MKKKLSIFVTAVFCALLFTACETVHTSSNKPAKMTDVELENIIKTKINSDAQLKAANLGVDADVNSNTATVSGTVNSNALRARALDLARSAQAGLVVTDKIEVKTGEVARESYTEDMAKEARDKAKRSGDSIGNSLEDAWIHTKIVAKLIGDSDTPQRKINVDVNNQVVTLRGTVETNEQKQEAERIAKTTDGVKSVSNQLKVGKA
jgi:hyperosmotically inducible periplasmic protein